MLCWKSLSNVKCLIPFFLLSQKCITALEKTWHPEHFFCTQCGKQFGEDGFHEKDGKPYCRDDYLEMFALKCAGCNRPITENYISAMNSQWHPGCFACRVRITLLFLFLSDSFSVFPIVIWFWGTNVAELKLGLLCDKRLTF